MDERVVFYSRVEVTNALGNPTVTYAIDFTTWASVTELTGNEKFEASQLTEKADVKLELRYRTDIDVKERFVYNSEFYDIYSINEMKREKRLIIFGKLLKGT